MTADELLKIARDYADFHGVTLTTVGRRSCGNDKIFVRLAAGAGCNSRSLSRAADWFEENWPADMRSQPKGRAADMRSQPKGRAA